MRTDNIHHLSTRPSPWHVCSLPGVAICTASKGGSSSLTAAVKNFTQQAHEVTGIQGDACGGLQNFRSNCSRHSSCSRVMIWRNPFIRFLSGVIDKGIRITDWIQRSARARVSNSTLQIVTRHINQKGRLLPPRNVTKDWVIPLAHDILSLFEDWVCDGLSVLGSFRHNDITRVIFGRNRAALPTSVVHVHATRL